MLKEINSSGHLKMSKLDGDKSIGMCDRNILDNYYKQLKVLSDKYDERIVWGLAPYTGQPTTDVIYYIQSYPIYLGGRVKIENSFKITECYGKQLEKENLLQLCDYLVEAELKLVEKTYKITCGILMMDKTKRKIIDIPQIWISEKDTTINEGVLDWFCYHFVKQGFNPVVTSRKKIYGNSSLIACGIYYEGATDEN